MRSLHVCFRSGTADNCCDCRKCLLAMLTLEVSGAMSRLLGVPAPPEPRASAARLPARSPYYSRLYGDVLERARAAGRTDIAKAIAACRWRYRLLKPGVTVLDWLEKRRVLWRIDRVLRPALLERNRPMKLPKGMAPTPALPAPRRQPLGHRRSALGRVKRIRRTIPSRRIRRSRIPLGRLSFVRQPPMELVSVRIEESPHAAGRVRLVGDVSYDDRPGTEAYWFEVDEEYAGALSLSGSPWLACLLPLAVTLGQTLRSASPVDPLLFENAPRLMETWTTWYRKRFPNLRVVADRSGDREGAP